MEDNREIGDEGRGKEERKTKHSKRDSGGIGLWDSAAGGGRVRGVNHIEIFLFHTRLQLKPNLRSSSSRTSVMFGCGSFSTAPPLPTSPANPPSKKSFIHLLAHPAWEEDGDEGRGWAAAMRRR